MTHRNGRYTEASYMMAKKLRLRAKRFSSAASAATPGTYTHLFKSRTVDMAPLSTRIPLGCANPIVFRPRHEEEAAAAAAKARAKQKALNEELEKKEIPDPPAPVKLKVKKASAYLSFLSATRPILKVEQPDLPFGETTKVLAQRWAVLSEEDRIPFKENAAGKKAIFDEAAAKYKEEVKVWKAECKTLAKIRKAGRGVGGAAGVAYSEAAARAVREGWSIPEVPKKEKKEKKIKALPKLVQPTKMFNNVVSLLGHDGLFFVLTYVRQPPFFIHFVFPSFWRCFVFCAFLLNQKAMTGGAVPSTLYVAPVYRLTESVASHLSPANVC